MAPSGRGAHAPSTWPGAARSGSRLAALALALLVCASVAPGVSAARRAGGLPSAFGSRRRDVDASRVREGSGRAARGSVSGPAASRGPNDAGKRPVRTDAAAGAFALGGSAAGSGAVRAASSAPAAELTTPIEYHNYLEKFRARETVIPPALRLSPANAVRTGAGHLDLAPLPRSSSGGAEGAVGSFEGEAWEFAIDSLEFVDDRAEETDSRGWTWLKDGSSANGTSAADGAAFSPGPRLGVNSTLLEGALTYVQVAVRDVPSPSREDVLAAYVPQDGVHRGLAPFKYEMLSSLEGYLENGRATVVVTVLNLRRDVRFALLRGGISSPPELLAESARLVQSQPNLPTGVHLMIGHRPSDMLVQWSTRDAGDPIVRYGERPDDLRFAAPAVSSTYHRKQMGRHPANREGWVKPGMLHTAIMGGLTPGRLYYYTVGDAAPEALRTEPKPFLAHPGVGPHVPVSILGAADMGVGEVDGFTAAKEYQVALDVALSMSLDARDVNSKHHTVEDAETPSGAASTAQAAGNASFAGLPAVGSYRLPPPPTSFPFPGPYRLLLINGDLAYAQGYGALWDAYLYQMRDLLTSVPIVTSIANHERDCLGEAFYPTSKDSGGECGVPYYARFPMPRPNAAADQAFYSFDFGGAHVAVLSSEHDFTEGSPQHQWLLGDLGSVDRSKTPWLFLALHRPIYVDANDFKYPDGKQTTAIQLQTALEDALSRYEVDVVLAGHHHSYQRTCAVSMGVCRWEVGQDDALERTVGAPHRDAATNGGRIVHDVLSQRAVWAGEDDELAALDAGEADVFNSTALEKKRKKKKHSHGGTHDSHGTVHLLFGHGGADFTDDGFPEVPPWIRSVFFQTHGHVRMHLNETAFAFEAIDVTTGEVFDSVVVHKAKQHHHKKKKKKHHKKKHPDGLLAEQ